MEKKTKIHAEDGKQELTIVREFDLPVELLFKAYTEPEIVAQWMGTKVLKLENKQHGGWQFETTDPHGNVVFRANGVVHDFVPNERITRTFEMENNPIPAAFYGYLSQNLPTPNNHKIYFDYGNKTLDALYPPLQQEVDKIMIQKGFSINNWMTLFVDGADHSEKSWAARLAIPLEFMLK